MKKFFLAGLIVLFLSTYSFAQTNTWDGSSSNNWNTGANWSLNQVPTNAHDVIIDVDVDIEVNTSATINSLTISGSANVTLRSNGGARTITIDNTGNAIEAGSTLIIEGSTGSGTRSMSIVFSGSNRTMSIAGTLEVSSVGEGSIYNATNSLTTVTGIMRRTTGVGTLGTITSSSANLSFSSGGTYEHEVNGSSVPTATWDANSTMRIEGMTSTYPSGMGQSFGHVVFDVNSGTDEEMTINLTTQGNLSLANSGGGSLRLTDGGTSRTITVGGDFTHTTGEFRQSNGTGTGNITVAGDFYKTGSGEYVMASDDADVTLTVGGNVTINAGTFTMSEGVGDGTLNVAGNYSHTAGTVTEISTGIGAIIFNGSSTQVFTSGGTVTNTINYSINNNAILHMADPATVISGNAFTLSTGGTLGIKSPNGIVTAPTASGNIQTTTRTFNSDAHYVYNGTADQNTGNALPSVLTGSGDISVDNLGNTVTLGTNLTVPGTLTLTAGKLNIGTNVLTLSNAAEASQLSGGSTTAYIIATGSGRLRRNGLAASSSYSFPVGSAAYYLPAVVNPAFAGDLSVKVFEDVTTNGLEGGPSKTPKTGFVDAIWNVDTESGSGNATITINWDAALEGSTFATWQNHEIGISRYASGWQDGIGAGNNTTNTLTATFALGASSDNPFAAGVANGALPVKYSNISAHEVASGIQVNWTAYNEENLSSYIVERSANGSTFTAIGSVQARNSTSETSYQFIDPNPVQGINFYRLKNLDFDSRFGYSNIVKVNLDKSNTGITLYPNPVVSGVVAFQTSDLSKGSYALRIYTATGQEVYSQKLNHAGGAINHMIQLPAGLRAGLYSLQVNGETGKNIIKTFIIQ